MPDPFAWLGDLIAYSLLGLSPDSAADSALQFFVMDLAKLFALLVIVIYIMGLLLTPTTIAATGRLSVCGAVIALLIESLNEEFYHEQPMRGRRQAGRRR